MIPETLSHYRVLEKLGAGAMGEVYLAKDTKLDRTVALKILPPEFAENPESLERFVREAKAASAIKHANVAHIYEIGEADGIHFIAMEHVEGDTLAASLSGKPLPTRDILDIAVQVADALDEAHGKRITHRDIKPGNLMLTDRGQIKMLDFGLAKMAATSTPESDAPTEAKTATGMVMGTVQYMSPEQAMGRDVDGRSDIFSLGVVLYELATGRLPFSGASPAETLTRITSSPPEAIARLNYDVPAELERVIRKCLEKDPGARYQSARELLVDLKNLKRDTESGAVATSTPSKGNRRPALAVGALVLLAAGTGVFWFSGDPEQIDSLAVLPFENGSGDPEAEYFSDGVTESIISSLSKLPNVRVISRTSSFHYKGLAIEPETVGRELDVEALVIGRIVQRGDELSISAELVRTRDNGQIWGEQYQRATADIFDIQKEMALEISEALRHQLTSEQEERLTKQYTESPEAYEAYLKGRYHWNQRSEEGLRQAIVHFQEALEKDPNYALAYSGLADSYSLLGFYYESPRTASPQARAAAEQALELDDQLAEAHTSLGWVKLFYDWEFAEAERHFQRALALDPAYATAHQWYAAYLRCMQRNDEDVAQLRLAVELDPLSLIINTGYGWALSVAGRNEEADEQFRKTLELNPSWALGYLRLGHHHELQGSFDKAILAYERAVELSSQGVVGLGHLGHAYAKAGRIDEAQRVLERLDELVETRYVASFERASVYAGLGDMDNFFEWMEKAYQERPFQLPLVRAFPFVEDVEQDPRFAELLKRIGLEE
ncbi:MAG: serine/threonine-protein kinase [Acidobacteriota bacterium]|nr:MAG: serine/threonine-protein kinase [Acidobacteriota bacterium]